MSSNIRTLHHLKALASQDPGNNIERYLSTVLRVLAKWRSGLIANTIVARHGTTILSGPFSGMAYVAKATEGALAPRLLGTYESELHPTILEFAKSDLDVIIDIGCAEGYYAVGFARLMKDVVVHARDIDERARLACADLARRNDVSDRVIVGGEFTPENFADYRDQKVLILIDAEGAEDDILDPAKAPDLARMSILVETHPGMRQNVTQRLIQRFSTTHEIQLIKQGGKGQDLPDWLGINGHLDQVLAVWEWRSSPTPWLVMRPKATSIVP